jgi:hypothetical protein
MLAMIDTLISLPVILGGIVFMALTTVLGLGVYVVTARIHSRYGSEETAKELVGASGNLMRVVGWLLCLLLSMTFTNVLGELIVTKTAIMSEAAAILDVHHDLRRFGVEETNETHAALVDYGRSIIDEEWPALGDRRLSERTEASLRKVEDAILYLEGTNSRQKSVQSRLFADMDLMSGYRMSRLQQAREPVPFTLGIVFFGYLVTMVFFGIYPVSRAMLMSLSLYTCFVGVIIYVILMMSNPFDGARMLDPGPIEFALQTMKNGR